MPSLDRIERKIAQLVEAVRNPESLLPSLKNDRPDCFTLVASSIVLRRSPKTYRDRHGSNKPVLPSDRVVFLSQRKANSMEHTILVDAKGNIKIDDFVQHGNQYGYDTSELKGATYTATGAHVQPGHKPEVKLYVLFSVPVALIRHEAQETAKKSKEYAMVMQRLTSVATLDQAPLDKKTLTPEQIAKKHGVKVEQIMTQLAAGIKVELEHTSTEAIAREIALDHLNEFPDYYTRLKKVESKMDRLIPVVSRLSVEVAAGRKPGEIWKSKSGKFAAKNKKGVTKYFGENRKAAKNWADGKGAAPAKGKGKGKVKPKGDKKRAEFRTKENTIKPRGKVAPKKAKPAAADKPQDPKNTRPKGAEPYKGKKLIRPKQDTPKQGDDQQHEEVRPTFKNKRAQKYYDANKKFILSLPLSLQGRYYDLMDSHDATFDAGSMKSLDKAKENHTKLANILKTNPHLKDAFKDTDEHYRNYTDLMKQARAVRASDPEDNEKFRSLVNKAHDAKADYERGMSKAVQGVYDSQRGGKAPQTSDGDLQKLTPKGPSKRKEMAGNYKDQCTLTLTGSRSSLEAIKQIVERIDKLGAPGHSFEVFAGDGARSLPPKGGKVWAEKYLGGFDGDGGDRVTCGELVIKEAAIVSGDRRDESLGPGTNTGHGHVWERPDGVRMRCWPSRCPKCIADKAKWGSAKAVSLDAGGTPVKHRHQNLLKSVAPEGSDSPSMK